MSQSNKIIAHHGLKTGDLCTIGGVLHVVVKPNRRRNEQILVKPAPLKLRVMYRIHRFLKRLMVWRRA